MKRVKRYILVLLVFGGLAFLFVPVTLPENLQLTEFLNSDDDSEVVIIFNSGGWGNTPLEEAKDLAPIIEGIESTLSGWGYRSVVIPYNRTKDGILGKITGLRELFDSFRDSSKDLAGKVELIAEKFPDKKIIVTGLSNGASFVNETYEEISGEIKGSVYAVAVGTPFWTSPQRSGNILQINSERDTLARGEIGSLFIDLFKTPFRGAFRAAGHEYSWDYPEVNSQIVSFLENSLH